MDSQPITYVALLKQRQRAASAPVRRRAPPRAVDFAEPRAFKAPRVPAPAPAPTPARVRRAASAAPERVRRGTGTRTAGGAAKATCARVSVVEALDRRAQAIERRAQATTRFAKEIAAEAAECKAKKAAAAAAAAAALPGAAPAALEVVTRAVAPARVGSRAHASPPLASSTAPSPARAAAARDAGATPTRRDVGTAEVCALCSTREARESALLVELASSDSRWRRAVVHLESELGASRRHNRALEAALVRYGHAVQPAPRVASAGARDALAQASAHAPNACPEPPSSSATASAISTSSSRSTSTSSNSSPAVAQRAGGREAKGAAGEHALYHPPQRLCAWGTAEPSPANAAPRGGATSSRPCVTPPGVGIPARPELPMPSAELAAQRCAPLGEAALGAALGAGGPRRAECGAVSVSSDFDGPRTAALGPSARQLVANARSALLGLTPTRLQDSERLHAARQLIFG